MEEQQDTTLTSEQQMLLDVWQQHSYAEFVTKDVEAALDTMTEDAHVLLVPVNTGGVGKAGVREFYANHFIPNVPPEMEIVPISQTIGQNRLVEEGVARFTHSIDMDWVLPGIPATGKRIEMALVSIIQFRDGKIAHEHLYWDQAAVLIQLGLIDEDTPATDGIEGARQLLSLASSRNES